jgi:hypothetical protein
MFRYLREAFPVRLRFLFLVAALCGVSLALRFAFDTDRHFELDSHAVAPFVTGMAALYGVLAAFTIYVVWEQFIEAGKSTRVEAKELLDACRYATYLQDPAALDQLVRAVGQYADDVAREEWPAMQVAGAHPDAQDAFEQVYAAVNAVQFDDDRDHVAWGRMIEKLESASDARQTRIELAGEQLPSHLRILLYMAALVLLFGFFMLALQNDFLAVAVTVLATMIVCMTIEVIEDLDEPFGGHWAHTQEPFTQLRTELGRFQVREEERSL